MMRQRTYGTGEEVDFLIVGSGAAGGVLAKELSSNGFSVVVLEQGPWRESHDFGHDEFGTWFLNHLLGETGDLRTSFRKTEAEVAEPTREMPAIVYARGVGGSSVHFTANYWRFRPVDFRERSLLGPISGTGFSDWPITYDELEPYYSRVEWEVGVSGAPGPLDPPRSRPYPLPPMPVKSSGVLFERGARAMGWNPQPAPVAILSQAYDDRSGCMHCGYCMAYGCEFGAKSSTLVSMIPKALATGRCEIRPESTVFRIETNGRARAIGASYYDREGGEHLQRARAVVLAANGAETPRLLLMSASSDFPDGLANSSGLVGKYLMYNAHSGAQALFEHPLNEYKSIQVTRIVHDFYESDPVRGFYGGGGMDGRYVPGPILHGLGGLPPDAPRWGPEYKRMLRETFSRSMEVACATTSLPLERNSVSLDPELRDRWGRPAIRITYKDHPDDLATAAFLQERAVELLEAAGAQRVWSHPVGESTVGYHLLGTCRMGTEPTTSVVNLDHRAHDVPNLFVCDGSSLVSSGRGQPTMTIQALAFRAADRMTALARAGGI
jgi:choline dehydrogenase-like flavoprotein